MCTSKRAFRVYAPAGAAMSMFELFATEGLSAKLSGALCEKVFTTEGAEAQSSQSFSLCYRCDSLRLCGEIQVPSHIIVDATQLAASPSVMRHDYINKGRRAVPSNVRDNRGDPV